MQISDESIGRKFFNPGSKNFTDFSFIDIEQLPHFFEGQILALLISDELLANVPTKFFQRRWMFRQQDELVYPAVLFR